MVSLGYPERTGASGPLRGGSRRRAADTFTLLAHRTRPADVTAILDRLRIARCDESQCNVD